MDKTQYTIYIQTRLLGQHFLFQIFMCICELNSQQFSENNTAVEKAQRHAIYAFHPSQFHLCSSNHQI